MYYAFIAWISIILLGAVIYWKLWWDDGAAMTLRFTKWYFGIVFVAAVIVGACTFAGLISF